MTPPLVDTVTESYHASGTLSTEVREALTQGRVRLPIQEPAPAESHREKVLA